MANFLYHFYLLNQIKFLYDLFSSDKINMLYQTKRIDDVEMSNSFKIMLTLTNFVSNKFTEPVDLVSYSLPLPIVCLVFGVKD
jgi:hypothetical protein